MRAAWPACRATATSDHFGINYDIRTNDGEVAHSACVGFGLERIALALLSIARLRPRPLARRGARPAVAVMRQLLPLDPADYAPHFIHGSERVWGETNCYIDLWVEVLHSLGLDPCPPPRARSTPTSKAIVDVPQVPARGPAPPVRHRRRRDAASGGPSSTTSTSTCGRDSCSRSRSTVGGCPTPLAWRTRTSTSRRRSSPTCSTAMRAARATFTTPATSSSRGDDFDGIFRLGAHARPRCTAALRRAGAARRPAPGSGTPREMRCGSRA